MDEAKNMALLFFMDHLMQKNGRRTIHDLSCQFGARGFSQEMREAVGATQEDDEHVILEGFGEMDSKNHLMKIPPSGRQRDYTAEAVNFFVAKLEKFGPELQIKSLLGHRSQAAPEVRLVSGRHLREFYEFLEAQTEFFVVEGDRVRLANMPEPKIFDESEILDDEGRSLAGSKAKQASVDFLKGILEQNEDTPISLDIFYRRFCERFPHSVRQDVATNLKELLQFLKLNRNIFFIRSNKVSLVRNRDDGNGSESERSTVSLDSTTEYCNNEVETMFATSKVHRIRLIKSLKPAQEIVCEIMNDLKGNNQTQQNCGEKVLCVDFKIVTVGPNFNNNAGGGMGTDDFLSAICVASSNRIAIFDLVHSDSIFFESGLKDLLETFSVLKVIHDVKRVSTLLAQRYAVNMHNVFDTQIAHSIIQHVRFNKPLSELHSISFINLQRVYFPQSLMMSDVTPRKLTQTQNWSQRPITDDFLLTIAEECHCLMTALYRNVKAKLPESHQELFNAKCLEALTPITTRPPPKITTSPSINVNNLALNNSLAKPFIGSTVALQTGAKTASLEARFNGFYQPPARRRLIEETAKSRNNSPNTVTTINNYFNNNNSNGVIENGNNSKINSICQCQKNTLKYSKMVDSSTQTVFTGPAMLFDVYCD